MACESCVNQCPEGAISMPSFGIFVIDAERCDDCYRYGHPLCRDGLPRGPVDCIVPA